MHKDIKPYVKRTQKDYPLPFKINVVREYQETTISIKGLARKYGIQSPSTVKTWLEKFGILDMDYYTQRPMSKSAKQQILELEQKVKILEMQKRSLERQVTESEEKVAFLDMFIDIAEREFLPDLRKKCSPKQPQRGKLPKKST